MINFEVCANFNTDEFRKNELLGTANDEFNKIHYNKISL